MQPTRRKRWLAVRLDDSNKKRRFFSQALLDTDSEIQLEAAIMLSRFDGSMTNGIPVLVRAVTETNFLTIPTGAPSPGDQLRARQRIAPEALRKLSPPSADRYPLSDKTPSE